MALQFMAIGTFQTLIATAHSISQSVSRCIAVVVNELSNVAEDYIKFRNQAKQIQ